MAQFGSGRSIVSQNQSAVTDSNGNLIVSPDDTFGSSPLGLAALQQAMIGVPNGTFNILPPDVMEDISTANPLPYWDVVIEGGITTNLYWDENTQTWALQINTIDSAAGDTAIIRTRIPIINDDGLLIRHYLSSTLLAVVRPSVTPRWTLTLTAQYYDTTGAAIGTPYTIGSIDENNTSTTVIDGFTNASGAIDASAAVLEIVYTMDVTANNAVYDALIKTVTVATQYGAIAGGGGGSTVPDLIIEEFNTSTTWTVPAGVKKLEALIVGAAGGGGGGGGVYSNSAAGTRSGGGGGGGGNFVYMKNVYLEGATSVVVTIGSGGNGGTGATFTKAAGSGTFANTAGTNGSSGGTTSFGAFCSILGSTLGQGSGTAGTSTAGTVTQDVWHGTALGDVSGTTYFFAESARANGGNGGGSLAGGTSVDNGSPNSILDKPLPYQASVGVLIGNAGTTGTGTGGTWVLGGGGTNDSGNTWGGGGGGGGAVTAGATRNAGGGQSTGGGGGGLTSQLNATVSGTYVGTGGNGGDGSAGFFGGGGGGGGGAAYLRISTGYNTSTITLTGGNGGSGGDGYVLIAYFG